MAARVIVECPNHGGAFDCTPFCGLCYGEQEFPESVWKRNYGPDTFTCGDGWHECDDDDEHEHVTYLMFYSPDGDDDDALDNAPGRIWSLTGNIITAGRDDNADWLFITTEPTNH